MSLEADQKAVQEREAGSMVREMVEMLLSELWNEWGREHKNWEKKISNKIPNFVDVFLIGVVNSTIMLAKKKLILQTVDKV